MATSASAATQRGTTEPPPPRIGRYEVRSRLGEGATSEVFLARDAFHDRLVAIKRVRRVTLANPVDAHYSSRFFAAEAALVGRLKHPNVVQLFDAVDDPHEPYLVLEYVPGGTLRDYCRPDALLSLEQIVEVGFKCAMALGYVYRQGLIHRDVKPANLLATVERGRVLDVKISDFGSALNLDATRTQVFRVGSLTYMSPEQLDGADLDARADQYSLAAVLYHLIAGRPPFEASHQAALMHQICNAEPPPLADLRDGVPDALDAIVRKALAKSREQRHADWDRRCHRWWRAVSCPAVRCARCSIPSASTCCARSTSSVASAMLNCGRSFIARHGSAIPSAPRCSARGSWVAAFTSSPPVAWRCIAMAARSLSWPTAHRWVRWSIWHRAPTCACTAPT
jgi:eukaryotic-like serine/threonine-protein kinase